MTEIEKAIEILKLYKQRLEKSVSTELGNDIQAFEMAISALEQESKWIPVKTRPLTDKELRFYYDQYGNDNIPDYMLDCPLPEDGQEILITIQTKNGKRYVAVDTCACDEWGYYLERYDDFDGVIAWMPLPEPYKADKEEE